MIAKEKLNISGADSGKVCRPGCGFGCESGADLEGTCEESSGNRRRIK